MAFSMLPFCIRSIDLCCAIQKKKIVQHFTSFIASHLYRSETSMYHSVGNCVFLFLEAVLTFEHEHIVRASEAIKRCLGVCNRHRKKNTITESIGKTFKRVSLLAAFCDSSSQLFMFFAHIFSKHISFTCVRIIIKIENAIL